MSWLILTKLLAIFLVVAGGWFVGRMRWLGEAGGGGDPARVLANVAFYIFVPALLFRTTARLDFQTLPWGTLVAFFVPVVALLLAIYAMQRRANRHGGLPAAAPSVRAISATFGNTLQVGVPVTLALYGEAGLGIHMMVVSVHALVLLTVLTALVELDLARSRARDEPTQTLAQTLSQTARNTIIHPVVLPVLAGMAWNATDIALPPVLDEVLALLGTAVVPLCLVLIGMSLAYCTLRGRIQGALVLCVAKLLLLPALVLVVAHWGFGLSGLGLNVIVMIAALPVGSNALIFSQRYETLEAEATAAIVFSTLGYALTAPVWLWVLGRVGSPVV